MTLQTEHSLNSPPMPYEVFITPIPENILGTDILQGQTPQTSISEFHFPG